VELYYLFRGICTISIAVFHTK